LKEKDEQIKILTSKVDEYEEVQKEGRIMSKEIAQRFTDLEEKFNDLMGVKKKESKYNREFELEESNPITKEEKFDLFSETRRERIKKQGELERHL
jgi:ATP-dependent exoDNAse (exonuclease V) alpha subunit